MDYKPLPVGYENFADVISEEYYYVDKTLFVKELLDQKGKVNLFTRPRRFGKTLTLSMLQYFFEEAYDRRGNKVDYSHLFAGLKIMEAGERYTRHMGKYPVISLTLKSGRQSTFESSMELLINNLADEFVRHRYVLDSNCLDDVDKDYFLKFMGRELDPYQYKDSLKFLSRCLKAVTGKDVIVLLDEYDVPLEGAYHYGFYDRMVDFIRELFGSTVKTNNSLYFAVITGCLRISKESIFTGINNLDINSIMRVSYGEYFGFTDDEVRGLCSAYHLEGKYEELKEWYNGYYFGDANVYNPWSTILYVKDHAVKYDAFPVPYWANTSSNSIVKTLIEKADREVKDEIENLIAGGTIEKPVHEDITYDEVYESMDNLWNFMLFTGYLKKVGERFEDDQIYVAMKIPNKEVLYIFKNKVRKWFEEKVKRRDSGRFFDAIASKDVGTIKEELRKMLYTSISFHDYYENFYHGFLAGLLYGMEYYVVKSNRESGTGRTDLALKPEFSEKPVYIFEFKIARARADLAKKADEALRQIEDRRYADEWQNDGYSEVVKYGIAFFEKDCAVVVG